MLVRTIIILLLAAILVPPVSGSPASTDTTEAANLIRQLTAESGTLMTLHRQLNTCVTDQDIDAMSDDDVRALARRMARILDGSASGQPALETVRNARQHLHSVLSSLPDDSERSRSCCAAIECLRSCGNSLNTALENARLASSSDDVMTLRTATRTAIRAVATALNGDEFDIGLERRGQGSFVRTRHGLVHAIEHANTLASAIP